MADTSNDKEVLKRNREEKRKEMDRLRDYLNSQMGFNSGDKRIDVRENNVGQDTLFVAPGVDLTNLPDGWKYEANYNLDGATKEVIYRVVDGKYEYIPIGHDINKSQVVTYRSPEDVVDAILAENKHIDKSQIYFDRHSNVIKIVGVVNDIRMPAGLEMRDNEIVDVNDYGKYYQVQKSLANDISNDDMMSGTGDANSSDVKEHVGQEPYHDDIKAEYKEEDKAGATIEQFGIELFNWSRMKFANDHYAKDRSGNEITQGSDGNYHTIDGGMSHIPEGKEALVEATLELNSVWIRSYTAVVSASAQKEDKQHADAFNSFDESLFNSAMLIIKSSPSRNWSDIMLAMSQNTDTLVNYPNFLKTMGVFLTDPQVSKALGIENVNNASPALIGQTIDGLVNQHLKTRAESLLEMDDNAPVMEMIMQKNNNGSNY